MIHKSCGVLLASMICVGAVLAGCSDDATGSPRPADSTTQGSSEPSTTQAGATPSTKRPADRPREIKLDGKDPCALVPQGDWAKFYIEKPGIPQESKTFKSRQCFYGTNIGSFTVTLVVTEGIQAWNRGGRNADVADAEPIEGFPAISVAGKADRRGCYAVVDVADGQYLMSDVGVTPSAESKVPEKCEYAHQLAESAMKTLVGS